MKAFGNRLVEPLKVFLNPYLHRLTSQVIPQALALLTVLVPSLQLQVIKGIQLCVDINHGAANETVPIVWGQLSLCINK